jgi:hypothetical protein
MKKYFAFMAGLFLLVGTSVDAMPPKQHYKTWRLVPPPSFSGTAHVRDQFIPSDNLSLGPIDFLSNPTRKDTYLILDPNLHYSWFRATGTPFPATIEYSNQFTNPGIPRQIQINLVKYLLVPTRKDPHPSPADMFTHYKAYQIANPAPFTVPRQLEDQFDVADGVVENVGNFQEVYFLTPCSKNFVAALDSVTHYVAYSFLPQRITPQVRQIFNQFGTFIADANGSELLLVPSQKILRKAPGLTTYGLIMLALLLTGTAAWALTRRRMAAA